MAIIEPTNKTVKDFEGLHLYHGNISNCSMRVRMTLEEKGLEWVSHHIDLKKKENINDEYFGINPNGLVPTLVHDGVVHIESNDIIDYLDTAYPEPLLRSADKEAEMLDWLKLSASLHVPAIKPYVYAKKMAPKVKKSQEEQAKYEELQKNEELKKFHSKHAGQKTFSDDDVRESERLLADAFAKLETSLEDAPWIMGEQFSLADISWIPIYFVIVGCGYDFSLYPNIKRWAASVQERDSYRKGISDWCEDFAKV
jgi:GST-like protein|tara:strand:- start:295 stop:1059 length:765 start_codon:yes stop_codon:yes gene_type:complete